MLPQRRLRALCGCAISFGLALTVLAAVAVQSEPAIPFNRNGHITLQQGSPNAQTKVCTVNSGAMQRSKSLGVRRRICSGHESKVDPTCDNRNNNSNTANGKRLVFYVLHAPDYKVVAPLLLRIFFVLQQSLLVPARRPGVAPLRAYSS